MQAHAVSICPASGLCKPLPGALAVPAALTDEREGVVYDVALALANGRLIPQDLHERAVKTLGHEGITDVIVLIGYYTCVSLTMNFYGVPASGGGTPRH